MTTYLEVTEAAGRAFLSRSITGSIVMLNPLRFRDSADYSATPSLAPAQRISGEAADRLDMAQTLPPLAASANGLLVLCRLGNDTFTGSCTSCMATNGTASRRSNLRNPRC